MSERAHLLIVEARFYEDLADEQARGAIAAIEAAGATYERISVPGALEIPAAICFAIGAMDRAGGRRYDGFVALGCVIRGETYHFDIVSNESACGLATRALTHEVAIGNGILTVENGDQAWARAKVSEKNKGGEAADAALAMIRLKRQFARSPG